MYKLLHIAVLYNSYNEAIAMVKNLSKLMKFNFVKIIIVDNSDKKNGLIELKTLVDKYENVTLIASQINRGYFGGARYALDDGIYPFYKKVNYLIVSNVDFYIKDLLFYEKLISYSPDKRYGLIAPDIISIKNGCKHNPKIQQKPIKKKFQILNLIFSSVIFTNIYMMITRANRYIKIKYRKNDTKAGYMYACHGSFMIFTSNYFKKGGNLDFDSFLFGEEVFVAETCKQLNLKIGMHDELAVYDIGSVSTGKIRGREMVGYMKKANQHILDLYY
jgi:GT2 family glycosyltransferase